MMDPTAARRIILALMPASQFDFIADITRHVAEDRPVQEDFGFALSEIERAIDDRQGIARCYSQLKRKRSFWAAEIEAKTRFLTGEIGNGDRG